MRWPVFTVAVCVVALVSASACSVQITFGLPTQTPTLAVSTAPPASPSPTVAATVSSTPTLAAEETVLASPTVTYTSTPSSTLTETPTATLTETATATITPTPTVTLPPPTPGVVRIAFSPGATSATVAQSVAAHQTDRYVLWALAGQTMTVEIVSPDNDVLLSIIGADGVPLKRYVDGLATWSGVLPKDQDYYLHAVATGGATSYELTVWIPPLPTTTPPPTTVSTTRITFAAGTTSATEAGFVGDHATQRYVLAALAGQTMGVNITSLGNTVLLQIIGEDGAPLKRYIDGDAHWVGRLHKSQDYYVEAVNPGGPKAYGLTVWVSAIGAPAQRISFAPGATSATVSGSIGALRVDRYVLGAMAGQSLHASIVPTSLMLVIEGQDNWQWSEPGMSSPLSVGALPATQDYVLTVIRGAGAGMQNYDLTVEIPAP